MKNKKGFTLVELLSVIVILAIIIAIAVPTYGRISSNINKKQYENKISLIEAAALKYADDTNYVSFYIKDLVEKGYLDADDAQGNVINSIDGTNMNCFPISIREDKDLKYATIERKSHESSGECDTSYLLSANNYFSILDQAGNDITNYSGWTRNSITLHLAFKNGAVKEKIIWYNGLDSEGIEADTTTISEDSVVLNRIYKVRAIVTINEKQRVLDQYFTLQVDKIPPKFKSNDKRNELDNKWEKGKTYTPQAYDTESGYYGSKLIGQGNNCPTQGYDKGKISYALANGNYKICIMDNVGNINEDLFNISKIDAVDMQCNINLDGTAGKYVEGKQWYKSDVTVTVTPQNVGLSGVELGVNTSSTTWPTQSPSYGSFTYQQYQENSAIVKATTIHNENTTGTTYYGHIRNQTGDNKTCSKTVYLEKTITAPSLVTATSTYDSITATYNTGSAISGIASTACYLTDSAGVVTSNGTLSGNNCVFSVTPTSANTTYYFKRCITSNAGNTACSVVSGKTNVGYCTAGNYTETSSGKTVTDACGTCGKAQNTYTYTKIYTSKYQSKSCGSSAGQIGHDNCPYPNCCSQVKWVTGNWGSYGKCSAKCPTTTGTQTRTRTVSCVSSLNPAVSCSNCPSTTKPSPSDSKSCSVDCWKKTVTLNYKYEGMGCDASPSCPNCSISYAYSGNASLSLKNYSRMRVEWACYNTAGNYVGEGGVFAGDCQKTGAINLKVDLENGAGNHKVGNKTNAKTGYKEFNLSAAMKKKTVVSARGYGTASGNCGGDSVICNITVKVK